MGVFQGAGSDPNHETKERRRQNLVRTERLKQLSNYFNGSAIGVFAIGGVAGLVADNVSITRVLLSLLASTAFMIGAQLVLGQIKLEENDDD